MADEKGSTWEYDGDGIRYHFTISDNATAEQVANQIKQHLVGYSIALATERKERTRWVRVRDFMRSIFWGLTLDLFLIVGTYLSIEHDGWVRSIAIGMLPFVIRRVAQQEAARNG